MSLKKFFKTITSRWGIAVNEQFAEHPVAELFRNDFKNEVASIVSEFDSTYTVKASVGAGAWASVPWLSVLNPVITKSTQDGIYPVYLFKADGSGFYLSLNQGTTTPIKDLGRVVAHRRAQSIKDKVLMLVPGLKEWGISEIALNSTTALGKSYEKVSISAKYYDANNIPNDADLKVDLVTLLGFYQEIADLDLAAEQLVASQKSMIKINTKKRTQLPKPFLLLAGISGTGKTRFIREQAKASGNEQDTYCLVSVRPDWHEPSDLLGYVSRLNGVEYVVTDVLKFLVRAWKEIINTEIVFNGADVCGSKAMQQSVSPFWLCLDEMNLAPVEQYFADYLSVIETREWVWTDDQFEYKCAPLLKPDAFDGVDKDKLRAALNLSEPENEILWQHFLCHGISLPFNLIVAGTVNMDETTHGFSRKVIDRALTVDFGGFFPNDFNAFFKPTTQPKLLTYPTRSNGRELVDLALPFDGDGQLSINFLSAVNNVLNNTPFKLAYRALNELLLSVMLAKPNNAVELQALWDDFLMSKILPRIEGDIDKLSVDGGSEHILTQLESLLSSELSDIWQGEVRPDLYREGVETDNKVINIACRSKVKIAWMSKQLDAGFTSFWP